MEHIGILAAILTTGAFLPQVYKTIKSGQTDDLSLLTFMMIFIGTICWSIYGYFLNDMPLIVANGITGFLAGILIFMKLTSMYKKATR